MEKKTRDWPNNITRMTDEKPARIATVTDLREPFVTVHVFADRERDRGFAAGGAKILDRGDAAEHVGEEHVKNRAEDQRTKNADRHVAFRISRFLRGGRDGIESDVSEEDDAGRAENSENSAVGMSDALRRDVKSSAPE